MLVIFAAPTVVALLPIVDEAASDAPVSDDPRETASEPSEPRMPGTSETWSWCSDVLVTISYPQYTAASDKTKTRKNDPHGSADIARKEKSVAGAPIRASAVLETFVA